MQAEALTSFFREALLENVTPFWVDHARDEQAGYATCLNRDGSVYDRHKVCSWGQGRILWTFSHLCSEWEAREDWLAMAAHAAPFAMSLLEQAADHGVPYSMSREGVALEQERDIYGRLSLIAGLSAYARATGDHEAGEAAWQAMQTVWERLQRPGQAYQPLWPCRAVRLFGHAMITMNVIDECRLFRERPEMAAMTDTCLDLILERHVDPETGAAREVVDWEQGAAPAYWGRWVNPGHNIEGGIFVIHEARRRGDRALQQRGLALIRVGLELGWDDAYGGFYNDVTLDGAPFPEVQQIVAQSKLWWQHAEALYGLLLAHRLTGDVVYGQALEQTVDYCRRHFVDPEYPGWFGLLARDGRRISDVKGTSRKNCYHLGRNLLYALRLQRDGPDWRATA